MKKIFLMLFIGIAIYSCGYHHGIVQQADRSYLTFTGNWENVTVQIDDMKPFVLENIINSEGKGKSPNKKLYQLSPGKHTLKMYRNGELLINRILFLENQVTKEIQIP